MYALYVFILEFFNGVNEIFVCRDKDRNIALVCQGRIQHFGDDLGINAFFLCPKHVGIVLRAVCNFMMVWACAFRSVRSLLTLSKINRHARNMCQNFIGPIIKLGFFGRISIVGTDYEQTFTRHRAVYEMLNRSHQNFGQFEPVSIEARLRLRKSERIVPKIKKNMTLRCLFSAAESMTSIIVPQHIKRGRPVPLFIH